MDMMDARKERADNCWRALDVDTPRGGCFTTLIRADNEDAARELAMVELGWRGARDQVFREAELEEIDGALDGEDFIDITKTAWKL